MSGPYSTDFPFLDGHQAPYIFEDRFIQSVSPYSVNPYQYEHISSAPQPLSQPQNHSPLAHDGLPPSKRLRLSTRRQRQNGPQTGRSTPPRSTTPDFEPPYHARIFCSSSLPGGFSDVLSSSLPIPDYVGPEERLRRQREIRHILTATKSTTLPPPSPFAKGPDPSATPDSPTDVYRIRAPPARISILPMQPKRSLGAFVPVADAAAGAEREAAVAHNNELAAARLADMRWRNNASALRSRNRKERAVASRTEELSGATAQMNWWKARAVRDGPDELGIARTTAAKRKKRKATAAAKA
ncbi:hypothetical protein LX36DRAFT_680679 [Colletotrichum falcatum]|nr:hypothetical protein LX36DRAFT_680679 [Colletotrichum falcatum]